MFYEDKPRWCHQNWQKTVLIGTCWPNKIWVLIKPLRWKKNKNVLNLVVKDITSMKQSDLALIDIFYNLVCYLTDWCKKFIYSLTDHCWWLFLCFFSFYQANQVFYHQFLQIFSCFSINFPIIYPYFIAKYLLFL